MPTSTRPSANSPTVIEIITSASTSVSNSASSTSPSSRVVKRVSSGIRHHRRHHHHHRHAQSTQSVVSLPVTSRSYDSGRDIVIQLPFVDNRVRTVTAAVLWPSSPIRCPRSSTSDRFSSSPNSLIPAVAVDSIHSTSSSGGALPVLVSSILDGALKKHSQLSARRANNTQLFLACDSGPNTSSVSRSVQMFGETELSD